MDLKDEVPVLILDVLEADIAQDAGVVDEDVDTAKSLDGSVDDLVAVLDGVVVGDGLATVLLDLVDNNVGSLCDGTVSVASHVLPLITCKIATNLGGGAFALERATQVVDDDAGSSGTKEGSICLTQAATSSSHDDDLAVEP